MSDLISRADAIEAICGTCSDEYTYDKEHYKNCNCYKDGKCPDIEALEALPSADAEWIPCNERLPKENARYLVQMSYGMMQVLSWANVLEKVDDFDFYNEKHGGWYELDSEWGYCERHEVIAWMPLPKPYKGGDDE